MKFAKQGRVVLEGEAYRAFIRQVFARDGWRCRRCNTYRQLQAHHLIKRSKTRLDVLWNVLTLCAECHEHVERGRVTIVGDDANGIVTFQ